MTAVSEALHLVLADDHPVFLSGLQSLIRTDPSFNVVATCSDGRSALQAILEIQPDLAVLDISMPGLTGIEVLADVKSRGLKTRVIFLTASAGDHQIVQAVLHGAYGLMLKDTAADALLECMRAVSTGRRWLPEDLVKSALKREEGRQAAADRIENGLTSREREIVVLAADGQSNKEIARQIGITEGTVKLHLHKIYQKLGVSNRASLTALSIAYRDELLRTKQY
jgi:two-component system nitrate/nitrite response regulator NarL